MPRPIRPGGGLPRCRNSWPTSGRAATSASISCDQVAREAKPVAGVETPDRQLLHGALDHQPATAARRRRRRCRRGSSRYERSAGRGAVQCAPRRSWRKADPADRTRAASRPSKRPAWQVQALATCAAAALRRALDAGDRGGEAGRQEERGWRVGLADGRTLPFSIEQRSRSAQARAVRRGLCSCRVTDGPERQGQRRARRTAGAPAWCRARRWCWRTRPAASWR